ncbi:MAG: QueT transporter family protein [Lachnospiraceae bacterium]|nr:QueT transporter family protein [Lachnospiraceae bacterium]
MRNKSTLFIAQAAMIAAVYVVLTFVFAPISFGEIQVRISEALTILPVFTPAAIPGLFVGCRLGNMLSGAYLPDVIFGSLATLLGAIGTRALRNASPFFAPLPPIIANALIVPFVLRYTYGVALPIPLMMLTVGVGEVISCGGLGLILYFTLGTRLKSIFRDNG